MMRAPPLESRKGCADTCVISNVEVLVEWNVEINSDDRLLAGEVVGINVLLHVFMN